MRKRNHLFRSIHFHSIERVGHRKRTKIESSFQGHSTSNSRPTRSPRSRQGPLAPLGGAYRAARCGGGNWPYTVCFSISLERNKNPLKLDRDHARSENLLLLLCSTTITPQFHNPPLLKSDERRVIKSLFLLSRCSIARREIQTVVLLILNFERVVLFVDLSRFDGC